MLSPDENKPDDVALTLSRGEYLVEIYKTPFGGRPVTSFVADSFEGVANGLVRYHLKCLSLASGQKTLKPVISTGAGSDRGCIEYSWMVEWKLNSGVQLTRTQESLLRGIVDSHNWQVDTSRILEYAKAERLARMKAR